MAEGHDYFSLGVMAVSEDHTLAAYSEDFTGGESYTMRVRDLASGKDLSDVLEGTYYSFAWTNDGNAFYYTTHDEAMRPHRIWLHHLGGAPSDDVLVFEEPDERFFLSVGKSRSKRFVYVHSGSMTTSETWFVDAASGSTDLRVIEPRRQDVEYDVDDQGDRFLIVANDTGRNFRLVQAPIDQPGADSWEELIPHRDDVKLEFVEPFAGHSSGSSVKEDFRGSSSRTSRPVPSTRSNSLSPCTASSAVRTPSTTRRSSDSGTRRCRRRCRCSITT